MLQVLDNIDLCIVDINRVIVFFFVMLVFGFNRFCLGIVSAYYMRLKSTSDIRASSRVKPISYMYEV